MAQTTTNLPLTVWDNPLDHFSYQELAVNFQNIGAHDHSPGRGKLIPTEGLANGAVTSPKINDAAVTSNKIQDGAVSSGKLTTDSVSTDKVQDNAITSAELALNSVTSPKIADGAITTNKLNNGSVSFAKLATDAQATIGGQRAVGGRQAVISSTSSGVINNFLPSNTWTAVPLSSLTIYAANAGTLMLNGSMPFATTKSADAPYNGTISYGTWYYRFIIDGSAAIESTVYISLNGYHSGSSIAIVWSQPLAAGNHTISLEAKTDGGNGGSATAVLSGQYNWMLI